MGHDEHFLQRLDRVTDQQVELALTLYRDEGLLQQVLASVELPDSVERVAVSLEDDVLGPFIVLTRTGRFVTCLAKGMQVSDLPIITRARFDVAAGRLQRARDELARLKRITEQGAAEAYPQLMRRLFRAGPRFCREDAELLASVVPLMVRELSEVQLRLLGAENKATVAMRRVRFDRMTSRIRECVMDFDRIVWACAHLAPILASTYTNPLLSVDDSNLRAVLSAAQLSFGWYTSLHGFRALWCVAQTRKVGLHHLRRNMALGSPFISDQQFGELAHGIFALSSSKLRAEASKGLTTIADGLVLKDEYTQADVIGRLGMLISTVLEAPREAMVLWAEHIGRTVVGDLCPALYLKGLDLRTSVPRDVALAALANQPVSFASSPSAGLMIQLVQALPWLAEASVGDLFLPRAWLERLVPESTPASVEAWFTRAPMISLLKQAKQAQQARTTSAAPKIGRNDPCACGSGKKAKRCCAAVGTTA